MPFTSIIVGLILIIIGITGYVIGYSGGRASVTALIPAFFGIVMLLLGLVARGNDALRKHLMHAAAAVALLGFVLTAGRILMKISEFTVSPASLSQVAMAMACLAFVILAVRSFMSARAERLGA